MGITQQGKKGATMSMIISQSGTANRLLGHKSPTGNNEPSPAKPEPGLRSDGAGSPTIELSISDRVIELMEVLAKVNTKASRKQLQAILKMIETLNKEKTKKVAELLREFINNPSRRKSILDAILVIKSQLI